MIYTQEEKAKMDALLNAFRSYVDRKEHYDVVYSEKAGYLRVITGAGCDTIYFPISSFAEMLRMFTDDFLSDEECRVGHSLKRDYDYVRCLMMPRLDILGPFQAEACIIMEETFDACRSRAEHFRQEHMAEIRHLEELIQHLREAVIL
ncbi:MAG: hypothetical protein IIX49_00460 [Oscillospiraceae bacterium]|nr:hypothetical protein [Oscillospiraceae bacterium]